MIQQSNRGCGPHAAPEAKTQSGSKPRSNIRLVVAYDGTDFHGWQRQPSLPTVQGLLEERIARLCQESVTVHGSGRSDAGVHALGQVANFTTSCRIPCANLVKALNALLPPTVRVREASVVPPEFHARYDARSKTYRYRIVRTAVCLPFVSRFAWHYNYPLDLARMAEAARLFIGKHDFTSFAASCNSEEEGSAPATERKPAKAMRRRASGIGRAATLDDSRDQSSSAVRTLFSSRLLWRQRTGILVYEVQGSGFLHHMVRNMVGTLVEIGRGKLNPQDALRILQARDRALAGPTAPPQGLCLVRVDY
jgi:tRNA pseudouridine38-40 synthase